MCVWGVAPRLGKLPEGLRSRCGLGRSMPNRYTAAQWSPHPRTPAASLCVRGTCSGIGHPSPFSATPPSFSHAQRAPAGAVRHWRTSRRPLYVAWRARQSRGAKSRYAQTAPESLSARRASTWRSADRWPRANPFCPHRRVCANLRERRREARGPRPVPRSLGLSVLQDGSRRSWAPRRLRRPTPARTQCFFEAPARAQALRERAAAGPPSCAGAAKAAP